MARELQERLLGETKLKSHPDSFPKFRLLDTPAEEGLREVALHFSHLLRYNGLIILWGATLSGAKLMDSQPSLTLTEQMIEWRLIKIKFNCIK